jgi:hypothetical protein
MEGQSARWDTTQGLEPLSISELRLNTIACGWLLVAEVLIRRTGSGKPYLELGLQDPRGNEITGRYFDPSGTEAYLPLEGKVQVPTIFMAITDESLSTMMG